MEAIIFIGIQGSGKSDFYKERFFNSHVRISLDLLKTRHREARLLQLCLETQQPFVIDNTNATIADRARYIPPAKEKGYRVIGYFFEVNVKEVLKRNEQRQGSERIPKARHLRYFEKTPTPVVSRRIRRIVSDKALPQRISNLSPRQPGRFPSKPVMDLNAPFSATPSGVAMSIEHDASRE
jgi:predicted kinase